MANLNKSLRFKHISSEVVVGEVIYNEPFYMQGPRKFVENAIIPLGVDCETNFAPNPIVESMNSKNLNTEKITIFANKEDEEKFKEMNKARANLSKLQEQGIDISPVLKDVDLSKAYEEQDENGTVTENKISQINIVSYRYVTPDSDDIENRGKYLSETRTIMVSSDDDFNNKIQNITNAPANINEIPSPPFKYYSDDVKETEKYLYNKLINSNKNSVKVYGNNNLPIGNNENYLPGLVRPPDIKDMINFNISGADTGDYKTWIK